MGERVKGYIYITGRQGDPAKHDNLNDPLFGDPPTLAACMPNLREWLEKGDYVFVVSAMTPGVQQYVIGGMRVADKIDAIEAFGRFPQNRLRRDAEGRIRGNIPVDENGKKHALDHHKLEGFDKRIRNFIVGEGGVSLQSAPEVTLGRQQTLRKLSEVFERGGNRPIDIIGRQSKLDEGQIHGLMDWLRGIKASAE